MTGLKGDYDADRGILLAGMLWRQGSNGGTAPQARIAVHIPWNIGLG
jgi:hypothetical protein